MYCNNFVCPFGLFLQVPRQRCSVSAGGDAPAPGPETAKLLRGRKFVSLNRAEEDIKRNLFSLLLASLASRACRHGMG